MNFDQYPPTVKTFLKLAQSFDNSDAIIAYHCCIKAKTLLEQTVNVSEFTCLSKQIDNYEEKQQFIDFKTSEKSPAEYLFKKAVTLLQSSDKQLKEVGPSSQLSSSFLACSYLFDLYEIFFPLNETSKKMQTYAKIKASECSKSIQLTQSPQVTSEPQSIPDIKQHHEIHYVTPVEPTPSNENYSRPNIPSPSQYRPTIQPQQLQQQPIQQTNNTQTLPQPIQPPQQEVSDEVAIEKYIQSAISSLDFEDPKTATQYLHAALELMK